MLQLTDFEKYGLPSIEELQPIHENLVEFVIKKRKDFRIVFCSVTYGYSVQLGNQVYTTVCNRIQNQIWMKLCYKEGQLRRAFQLYGINLSGVQDLLRYGIDLAIVPSVSLEEGWILRDFQILGHTKIKTLSQAELFMNFLQFYTPTGNQLHQQYDDGFMEIAGNFFTYDTSKFSNQFRTKDGQTCTIEPNSYVTIQIGGQNEKAWWVKLKSDNIIYSENENVQDLLWTEECRHFLLRMV